MNLKQGLESVDKFFIILTLVLIAMSVLLVFSFRGVFSLFLTAYEFDTESLSPPIRVNKENLAEAHNWVHNKEVVVLEQGL